MKHMEILEYLRCNCIALEDEVVDGTDIDIKDVFKVLFFSSSYCSRRN